MAHAEQVLLCRAYSSFTFLRRYFGVCTLKKQATKSTLRLAPRSSPMTTGDTDLLATQPPPRLHAVCMLFRFQASHTVTDAKSTIPDAARNSGLDL